MSIAAKRPCHICRRWFRPNVRIGDAQHTCSRPECQAARLKETQASWRDRNPDYFVGYRIQSRSARKGKPEPARLPSALSKLPWDIAQEEFGATGADFIGAMGKLLLEAAKDPIEGQVIDSSTDPGPLPQFPRKTRSKDKLLILQ